MARCLRVVRLFGLFCSIWAVIDDHGSHEFQPAFAFTHASGAEMRPGTL
jgi:hypothetical protein